MDGDLFKIISDYKKNGKVFTEDQIRDIMRQTLLGLNYIHSKGYFHRDVKPENLLTKTNSAGELMIKISDFGQAREIRSRPPFTEYVSTRWYRAPEVLLHSESYSYPIDLFAMGAMMAELYLLRPLFPGKSEIDQLIKICSTLGTPSKEKWENGYRNAKKTGFKFPDFKPIPLSQIIKKASPEAISLMKKLMEWNPKDRPTCQQALQHKFFQKKEETKVGMRTSVSQSLFTHRNSGDFGLLSKSETNKSDHYDDTDTSDESLLKRNRKSSVLGFPKAKSDYFSSGSLNQKTFKKKNTKKINSKKSTEKLKKKSEKRSKNKLNPNRLKSYSRENIAKTERSENEKDKKETKFISQFQSAL